LMDFVMLGFDFLVHDAFRQCGVIRTQKNHSVKFGLLALI
jgi:hypothetical protein